MVTVKVIEYTAENDLVCQFPTGTMHRVDPFVGEVIHQTEENACEVGESLVGKTFEMDTDCFSHGAYLPDVFREISTYERNAHE